MKRVPLGFARRDWRPLLLGGAILGLHFPVQIAGLVTITATNTGWIISVWPLAIAVLAFLFLRQAIGWREIGRICVATTGIFLLVSRGRVTDLGWLTSTGDWLVLASAHTWALYTVVTRGLARRRNPLAVAFGILLIAAALIAVPFAATADLASVRALSPRGVAALLYLAIPGLALGVQAGLASGAVVHRSGHRLRRGGRRRAVSFDRRRADVAGARGIARPRLGTEVAAGGRRVVPAYGSAGSDRPRSDRYRHLGRGRVPHRRWGRDVAADQSGALLPVHPRAASPDAGDSWAPIVRDLPAVLSVEVQTLA